MYINNIIIQKKIKAFIFCYIFLFVNLFMGIHAFSEPLEIKAWVNFETKEKFIIDNNNEKLLGNSTGIKIKKKYRDLKSSVSLNFTSRDKIQYDHSYLEFNSNRLLIGIGKINKNWSFSPNSSLILSKNARPYKTIYFNIKDSYLSDRSSLYLSVPWEFEAFNAVLSNSAGPKDTLLFGMRTIIKPTNNFKIELLKTSQWGGEGYSKNLSSFKTAIIGNSNEKEHANINQLAGFGLSYLINKNKTPFRLYAQFIGEDEAGNLPSCYMQLYGTEINLKENKYIKKIGIEYTDTRIEKTKNGFCGPNTAYNNSIYKYTNYDDTLGHPIDTEGRFLSISSSVKISQNTNVDFSIENILVNDASYSNHRLNKSQEKGWGSSLGVNIKLNQISVYSRISYQGFSLDNTNKNKGLNFNLNITRSF